MNKSKRDRELQQKALLATAMAFYDKGPFIQYDSVLFTPLSQQEGGRYRQHIGKTPEFATADTTLYTVCSVFCYEIYRQALGFLLAPNTLMAQTKEISTWDNGMLVYKWTKDYGKSHEEAMRSIPQVLEVGDLLVFRDLHDTRGHVMMYIGDGKVVHSAGRKYNMDTGTDAIEKRGSIWISPWDSLLVSGEVYDAEKNCSCVAILRPLRIASTSRCEITPIAQSRLKYPRLKIDRTCSCKPYRNVVPGQTLSYVVTITNNSNTDYERLNVSEKVPEKTVLVNDSVSHEGRIENGLIVWNILVKAGTTINLRYCVKVTGRSGEEIISCGGFVDQIPSNTIRHNIYSSGKTSDALCTKTVSDLVNRYFVHTKVQKQNMIELRPQCNISNCELKQGYVGGIRFHAACSEDYVFEVRLDHFDVGDTIFRINGLDDIEKSTDCAVYLGNGHFEITWGETTEIMTDLRFLESLFVSDLFFVIRSI